VDVTEVKCLQCQSGNVVKERLGTKGSAWPVTFGATLFKKRELVAYGCESCGHVFLSLGSGLDETRES
jgi:hypothetical protein